MSRPYPNRPLLRYAELSKIVSRLKIPVHWHVKKFRNPQGPEGRLIRLRQTVTALFKYERIELNYYRAEEARGYAERLISEAIRHGPQSHEMMDMADWWLEEKQLVHKLFKVLVPRFQHFPTSFTTLYQAPFWYFSDGYQPQLNEDITRVINETVPMYRAVAHKKAVLELKGHPYPPMFPTSYRNPHFLQNVLLSSAKAHLKSLPNQASNNSVNIETPSEIREANTFESTIDKKSSRSDRTSPEVAEYESNDESKK